MKQLTVVFLWVLMQCFAFLSGSHAGTPDDVDTLDVLPFKPDTPVLVDTVPDDLLPVWRDMRIEVDIRSRKLHVFSGNEQVATYPVGVGKPEWPTRTGSWTIHEVVWNPWWHPPDEEWADYYAIMAPGDPDNPLGRAQLIYDAPRSIHGTLDPESIGRAVSHGSIRAANDVVQKLARRIMESVGLERDEEWYENVQNSPTNHVRIRLQNPVPIRVYR